MAPCGNESVVRLQVRFTERIKITRRLAKLNKRLQQARVGDGND